MRGAIDGRPTYVLTRWLFLRLLGFIYLFAFASAAVQITGLIGSHGLLPVDRFLQLINGSYGSGSYLVVPTLFWLNSSDGFLRLLTVGGVILSGLVVLDIAPGPLLAMLWLFYLSLVAAGQDFMAFQWDYLLLEAGFLAIFFAPWRLLPGLSRQSAPSLIMIWLYRWLLFRLMVGSGLAKLMSGDETWRNLTALSYHYETQPLPSPVAWYAYQLPLWFHQVSTAVTLVIELVVPFLIFAPRRVRFIAAGAIALLQALIMLTGNYTFFNLLTIVLCIPLLDDQFLRRFFPRRAVETMLAAVERSKQSRLRRYRHIPAIVVAAMILLLSGSEIAELFLIRGVIPSSLLALNSRLAPFGIVNRYGLFAVMTTTRPEIIIEGSNDGQTWLPYEFQDKPGDVTRPPRWIAPYQPRLDWQMWFEALGGYGTDEWFQNLLNRLLEGSPDVLALLGKNPFPGAPPRYVRATLYNYHFTDMATRQATGAWWRRDLEGPFYPVTSLGSK